MLMTPKLPHPRPVHVAPPPVGTLTTMGCAVVTLRRVWWFVLTSTPEPPLGLAGQNLPRGKASTYWALPTSVPPKLNGAFCTIGEPCTNCKSESVPEPAQGSGTVGSKTPPSGILKMSGTITVGTPVS